MTNVLRVEFHRNGCGGEGFYLVEFTSDDAPDCIDHRLIATVFEAPGCIAVVDVDDLRACWRGDLFEDALREAVAQADADRTAYDHRP